MIGHIGAVPVEELIALASYVGAFWAGARALTSSALERAQSTRK
ncbi:MAG: hypothetical protein WD844_10895 [Thermoleophilaceae bacterium]